MNQVLDKPKTEIGVALEIKTEKLFFQVFLEFKNPKGITSLFMGDLGFGDIGCGIYTYLSRIFKRSPRDMYESVLRVCEGGSIFMQKYLSLEDASEAVARASLFAHVVQCTCFIDQGGFFFIKEVKK